MTTLEQQGTAAVDVQVATLAGGDIHVTTDREGSAAFQFPAYSSSGSPPLAVVRVTPDGDGGADPLAPGEADFLFGADFRQDAAPEDLISDYGANLMQRGLAGSEGQYKLQVDGGRPSCRIQGSDGAVKLDAGIRTEPHSWYRVRCSRRGDSVELRVIEYLPDGPARESIARGSGRIGSLTWAKTQTPLSVGGKLSSRGELKPDAPDQFNGVVSNPVLVIDD